MAGEAGAQLTSYGFGGSNLEQWSYLKYLETLPGETFPVINWLHLHDFRNWEAGVSISNSEALFASTGLKRYNGEAKDIWEEWRTLFME